MNQMIAFLGRHRIAVVCLLLIACGAMVYGYALNLPYHIDDFVHFRTLSEHTLADVWTARAGLGYYRPVPFSLWAMVYRLWGSYPEPIIHGINVVAHALNGALLFVLVHFFQPRVRGGLAVAAMSAVLFLLFPFSYQAVPWAGSLTHPLVTSVILGALVLAVAANGRRSSALFVMSLLFTLLAPFTHETGIMVALLLTLFYAASGQVKGTKALLSKTWMYWVCSLAASAVLLAVRSYAHLPAASFQLESRWQNAIYFLQGLAYPVAPLATRLMAWMPGLNDLGAIAIVCIPALLLAGFLYLRFGQARPMLFAVAWYALLIAPAWAMLEFSYVVDGPRLMYEASPGAAVFWALALAVALRAVAGTIGKPLMRAPVAVAGLAVLVVLWATVGSMGFLVERADMYEQTRLAATGLLESSTPARDGKRIIVSINFPGWIAPRSPTFALGHEGVTFIPDYSSLMDLVWSTTGRDRFVDNMVVTELQSHWRFNYRNFGREVLAPEVQPQLRNAYKVLFTSYRGWNLATYDAGNLELENQLPPTQFIATYGGRLALLSGGWRRKPEGLEVTLHWQSLITLTQEVRTFVHLQNEAGDMLAQEDGLPLMGVANPLWWRPGDQWRDTRVLILPATLKPGAYTLRVGIYPAAGGQRLEAVDAAGNRFTDDSATLGSIVFP